MMRDAAETSEGGNDRGNGGAVAIIVKQLTHKTGIHPAAKLQTKKQVLESVQGRMSSLCRLGDGQMSVER